MSKVVVTKMSYEIFYPKPLLLKEGDLVTILKSEEASSEWYGWHFCHDSNKNEGWISEDFIDIKNNTRKLIKDYTAKELAATAGQSFTILSESYGWYWCSTKDRDTGWLPKNVF